MQRARRRLVTTLMALALAPAARGTEAGTRVLADQILVLKAQRRLQLLHDGKVLREYSIALGRVSTGAKQFAGVLDD